MTTEYIPKVGDVVVVTELHPDDAHYKNLHNGDVTGPFMLTTVKPSLEAGYWHLTCSPSRTFYAAKVERVTPVRHTEEVAEPEYPKTGTLCHLVDSGFDAVDFGLTEAEYAVLLENDGDKVIINCEAADGYYNIVLGNGMRVDALSSYHIEFD